MGQQLDLFGGSIPPHQPIEKKVVPNVTFTKEEVVEVPINTVKPLQTPATKLIAKPTIIETPNYETVYQDIQKRKRGRPKKPLDFTPKTKLKRGRKSFIEINTTADLINVPSDEQLHQKMYYPISQVAKWFNTTNSQVRFWENEFDILQPKKNGKGDRFFRPIDVTNLKTIYHLLRVRKYSIDGAKDYLKNNKSKVNTGTQLKDTLENIKQFLLEIKATL